MTHVTRDPSTLTDAELRERVHRLVRVERTALVALLVHLAEVDRRGAYLADGASSLFAWCTRVLHMSEAAAYLRITAARAARRFPGVLERMARGKLHLTALSRLAPHLTEENHVALLDRARHATRAEVEALAALFRPGAVMGTRIEVQIESPPPPRVDEHADARAPLLIEFDERAMAAPSDATPVANSVQTESTGSIQYRSAAWASPAPASPAPNPDVTPEGRQSAPLSYRLHMTFPAATYARLVRLQQLMRHTVPDGDPVKLIDRALGMMLEHVERRRLGAATSTRGGPGRNTRKASHAAAPRNADPRNADPRNADPQPDVPRSDAPRPASPRPRPRSRHIPLAIRRAVSARDGDRCAFITPEGRRCAERAWLEYHHVIPFARGGSSSMDNIELRCRAHNQYEADREFGGSVGDAGRVRSASGGTLRAPDENRNNVGQRLDYRAGHPGASTAPRTPPGSDRAGELAATPTS